MSIRNVIVLFLFTDLFEDVCGSKTFESMNILIKRFERIVISSDRTMVRSRCLLPLPLFWFFADNKEVILPQKKRFFFVSNSWTAKYLVKVYQQLVKQILNSSYEFETMLTRIATQTTSTWWSFYRNPDPQNDPACLNCCFFSRHLQGLWTSW